MNDWRGIPPLDPRWFPGFVAAAELLNFTLAAKRAHMTQSGVSQHVAKLEEQLGLALFNRVGKQVVLTEAGRALLRYIREQSSLWSDFVEVVHAEQDLPSGTVAYAMPPSCLLSPHFSLLLQQRVHAKSIHLDVRLSPSPEVIELVLKGEIHFGFVTQRPEHTALDYEHFCDEEYILVSADVDLMASLRPEDLFHHNTIDYPGADVYYNAWLHHHASEQSRDYYSLRHSGRINAIDGAVTMAKGGLGCGVFPRHCVQHALDAQQLFEYRSTRPSLTNAIHICTLRTASQVRRVEQVLGWFRAMK